LRYIPSIPSFLRAFIIKLCSILLKAFSASIEKAFYASIEMIKSFLLVLPLMFCITFIDLHMLNHPCSPGIKPTWSLCMIFLMCCWIQFAIILLMIFATMFIKEIGL
jgi:hypothetical protein